jgi:Asp-tRNA(Asn)/Glu-tRNA(Gln) amidotransferase A subunit family amidase
MRVLSWTVSRGETALSKHGRTSVSFSSTCCPAVHAKIYADFVSDPAFVLSQARALDQIPHDQRGLLHGLAIGIKDIMNTKGTVGHSHDRQHSLCILDMPTQFGSPIYQGHQPGFDSSAVAILRAAGALIFGSAIHVLFPFS